MGGFSPRREGGVSGLMWKRGDDGGRGAAMQKFGKKARMTGEGLWIPS